jgi:hypothetical protein
MPGETLHEASVAIGTIMLTSRERIDDIWVDLRFGEDGFSLDFFDEHMGIIRVIGEEDVDRKGIASVLRPCNDRGERQIASTS